jgi:hypothetical protein
LIGTKFMMCAVQTCGAGWGRGILNDAIGVVGALTRWIQNAPRVAGSSAVHSGEPPPPASSPKTT